MPRAYQTLCIFFLTLVVASICGDAKAHPEDEFCVPGEGSLDPALCEALAELDSPGVTGDTLGPILDNSGNERSAVGTTGLYLSIGVRHILPAGLDHILFVLALFLSSTRLRALVIQISTFTVAHTATLALAAVGVISPPAGVVEPLIAATIAFVAIENLFVSDMPRWRPLLVFVFGLVHGLGFAGFFGDLGLPPGQFWSALIGFNIGVEIGQLAIIGLAFVLTYWLRDRLQAHDRPSVYRQRLVVPVSAMIGVVGLYWTVQRVLSQLA